jgi:hypothetical protein
LTPSWPRANCSGPRTVGPDPGSNPSSLYCHTNVPTPTPTYGRTLWCRPLGRNRAVTVIGTICSFRSRSMSAPSRVMRSVSAARVALRENPTHGYVQTLRDREEPVRGDGRSAEVADVESEDAPVLDQDVTLAAATLARWREVPSVRLTRVWAPTGMTAPTVSSVVSTGWRLPRTGGSRAIHVSNGTRTSTRCARTRASSGSCPRSARSGSGSSSWRDTRRPSIAWLPRAVEGRRYVIP